LNENLKIIKGMQYPITKIIKSQYMLLMRIFSLSSKDLTSVNQITLPQVFKRIETMKNQWLFLVESKKVKNITSV
jgi:hypothetical protein